MTNAVQAPHDAEAAACPVSVRHLCEFGAKAGDLDLRFTLHARADGYDAARNDLEEVLPVTGLSAMSGVPLRMDAMDIDAGSPVAGAARFPGRNDSGPVHSVSRKLPGILQQL